MVVKFLRELVKHIDSRHSIKKGAPGSTEKWAAWFDKLEFYANMAGPIIEKYEKEQANGKG